MPCPPRFTRAQVEADRRARQSRARPAEAKLFARQLGDILAYADQVQQVDTTGVPPTVRRRHVARRRIGADAGPARRSIATTRSPTRPTPRATPASSGCRGSSDDGDPPAIRDIRDAVRAAPLGRRGLPRRARPHRGESSPSLHAFNTVAADRALARGRCHRSRPRSLARRRRSPACRSRSRTTSARAACRTTASSRILEHVRAALRRDGRRRGSKRAGAVIVGKTNCDEFAMGSSTENSAFGPTRNPWALDRTPGGSSGGSAAAVAAGHGAARARLRHRRLDSPAGGALRRRRAEADLRPRVALRAARVRVVARSDRSADAHGRATPRSRSACIAGADPADATSAPKPVPDYTRRADGRRPRRARSACRARLLDERRRRRGVAARSTRRSTRCVARGATLVDVELPHARYAIPVYYLVATAEASSNLARYDGVRYGFRAHGRRSGDDDLRTMYARTRARGLRRRGEAAHHARHLRAERRLLRRVLPEGAAGAHADPARLRPGVRARRRRRHADQPDAGVQDRRARRRSAADVSRRRLHGQREPGRAAGDQRAVRLHRRPACRSACS